jgi:hypothetical protein
VCYSRRMDRAYWIKQLEEAERELDAAKGRVALNAAAKKLQAARAELKRLEAELGQEPRRPPTRPSRAIACSGKERALARPFSLLAVPVEHDHHVDRADRRRCGCRSCAGGSRSAQWLWNLYLGNPRQNIIGLGAVSDSHGPLTARAIGSCNMIARLKIRTASRQLLAGCLLLALAGTAAGAVSITIPINASRSSQS